MGIVWGYVLEGAGRPSRAKQIDALVAAGADPSKIGTIWHDKIAGRTSTRPRNKLEQRNLLVLAVMPGDTVVFHSPECLGVSPDDASWVLGELAAKQVTVIVNGDFHKIEPGTDTSDVLLAMRRWQKARIMRTYRSRKSR